MASGVKIVVFDWGGVILRICRSWQEGCTRAGLEVRAGPDLEGFADARHCIAHAYHIGALDCDGFCRQLSEAMQGLYTPAEMQRIHDAWLIEEYPGVAEVVRQLAALRSITTGLLSNTNHRHWLHQLRPDEGGTARFPTARLLRHRLASHLLGVAKPDAEIYERFERLSGCTGGEILFFDDLTENIAAARIRGWSAEQIDHEGDTATQIAGHLSARGIF